MFCNKCGNQFPDGVKYCPKCGNKIDGNDEQTKNNTAQQIEQPAVQTVEQQVAQQTKANEANTQNGVNVQNAQKPRKIRGVAIAIAAVVAIAIIGTVVILNSQNKALGASELAKVLPKTIINYTDGSNEYSSTVEGIDVVRRNTDKKAGTDDVRCTISLSDENYKRVIYADLHLEHFDQGGWQVTSWEPYDTDAVSPIAYPNVIENEILKRGYVTYKKNNEEFGSTDDGTQYCNCEYDVNDVHKYATFTGKILGTAYLSGTCADDSQCENLQWTDVAIDDSAINIEWTVLGKWYGSDANNMSSVDFDINSFDASSVIVDVDGSMVVNKEGVVTQTFTDICGYSCYIGDSIAPNDVGLKINLNTYPDGYFWFMNVKADSIGIETGSTYFSSINFIPKDGAYGTASQDEGAEEISIANEASVNVVSQSDYDKANESANETEKDDEELTDNDEDNEETNNGDADYDYWVDTFTRTKGPHASMVIFSMDDDGMTFSYGIGGSGASAIVDMRDCEATWTNKSHDELEYSDGAYTLTIELIDDGEFNITESGESPYDVSLNGSYCLASDVDSSYSNEFVFPESNSKNITEADCKGLTATECMIARNEIYAREGREFKDETLNNYFSSCDWYDGQISPDDFTDDYLNDYEKKNLQIIVGYEKKMGYSK